MPRPPRPLPAAVLAAAGLAAGWLLAPRPLPAQNETAGAGGSYAVAGGPVPVLLDGATGQTWSLARLGPGEHVWLPCERVDDPDRAKELRDRLAAAGPEPPAGPGGGSAQRPAGGAYFPGNLLGGDLIGGDLIGGDLVGGNLVGGNAIDGGLIGGNVVGKDLVEGELLDTDDTDAGKAEGEGRKAEGTAGDRRR